MNSQREFDFSGASEDGYAKWLTSRQVAVEVLARHLNLPLGHQVEVWLVGGVRLRGKLQLAEETLFYDEERVRHLALRVEQVRFTYREMESCVRLD